MTEFGKYVPPEAEKFSAQEQEKSSLGETGRSSIQGNIEDGGAEGVAVPFTTPDGNLATPEKPEIYRSPETTPEKEPGYGPKPSFDHPPAGGGTSPQDDTTQDADDE